MVKLDIRVGEGLTIGDNITIRLDRKSGQVARLAISVDPSLSLKRIPRADAIANTESHEDIATA